MRSFKKWEKLMAAMTVKTVAVIGPASTVLSVDNWRSRPSLGARHVGRAPKTFSGIYRVKWRTTLRRYPAVDSPGGGGRPLGCSHGEHSTHRSKDRLASRLARRGAEEGPQADQGGRPKRRRGHQVGEADQPHGSPDLVARRAHLHG